MDVLIEKIQIEYVYSDYQSNIQKGQGIGHSCFESLSREPIAMN